MSRRPFVMVTGDELASLSALRRHPEVMGTEGARSACSALVIGVAGDDARLGTSMLESVCASLHDDFTNLEHLVLVVEEGAHTSADALRQHSDIAAQNIQADIEQSLGSYLVVTVLLVGRCRRPAQLARSIMDRVRHTRVVDPATVLFWQEIENRSINAASADWYI